VGGHGPYMEREEGNILIAVVDVVHDADGGFSGSVAL